MACKFGHKDATAKGCRACATFTVRSTANALRRDAIMMSIGAAVATGLALYFHLRGFDAAFLIVAGAALPIGWRVTSLGGFFIIGNPLLLAVLFLIRAWLAGVVGVVAVPIRFGYFVCRRVHAAHVLRTIDNSLRRASAELALAQAASIARAAAAKTT